MRELDLEYIELKLENGETIIIGAEYIKYFNFYGVKHNISYTHNILYENNQCETFVIKISKKADTPLDEEMSTFDRLEKWQDIIEVVIHFNYKDDDYYWIQKPQKSVRMPYIEDDLGENNILQSFSENGEKGDLFICVSIDKNYKHSKYYKDWEGQ